MGRKEDNIKRASALMNKPDMIRNIGIAAHIDHGKTTLSDNLIAGAGMMSEELAGKQLLLDFDEQEQARGITINAANVSMVHQVKGQEHLINLIDTPGHVDFGGDVTRAMRAVDGAVVVVCAVEGAMPQTETVIRQALKENVKPVLFINKVDRLINELKVSPQDMQARFAKILAHVNKLIKQMVPAQFKGQWKVDPSDGSVAFGSAYHNWATSVPFMAKQGISFGDIYEHLAQGRQKELAKQAPLHEVLLDMVIQHLPTAVQAQKYRIPHIWHGDPESKVGRAMANCDPKGALTLMVTKIVRDPHAGEIAVGRLFSGTASKGQELHIIGMPKPNRVQQVGVYVGADRITVDEALAGNIVAISGLRDAIAGSSVTSEAEMEPFERIVHYSEPVVTVAVEAKHMKDLPKLVETLRIVAKADPSIKVEIDQETGEHLMSGMGELHLEITEYRITNEYGVPINTSPPIVVYRETPQKPSPGAWEGKSPNKHNRFYFLTAPLEEAVYQQMLEGKIPVGAIRKNKEVARQLMDLGMEKVQARGVLSIENNCMLIDGTKGIQYLYETRELLVRAFKDVVNRGPRAEELLTACKMILVDAKLHEDAIHRGEAQVIPAVRRSIYGAMVSGGVILLEPKQKVFVNVPQELMGNVSRELHQRRAVIEDMEQEGELATIVGKAPIAEMFGFANAIRSTTQGRALWSTEFVGYEPVPHELLADLTRQIRERKGLKPEPPDLNYYAS